MIREAIAAVVERTNLTETEAAQIMSEIMDGEATPAQLASFLTAMRLKGETVDEIVGMARVMRAKSLHVEFDSPLLDTCGTGGDGSGTFNVSTAAALVCAAAGVKVAKHGNRAASSASGSADVLEALGARIDLSPEQVRACIDQTGFGFMFAQTFHPSMKYAAAPRREIGIRTVFNFLGPLTNPAGAERQLVGVGDPVLARKLAEALQRLGSKRALIASSEDGLDEVSISAPTAIHELRDGEVHSYSITPADAGIAKGSLRDVLGGTPAENAERIRSIFDGVKGPARDFVVLNSAAALLAADQAESLKDAAGVAARAVDSGAAARVLQQYVELTCSF